MSRIRPDTIWQHDKVLPYILGSLRQKIDAITPVQKIYLTGSRARNPVADWDQLSGKDWDILVVCSFPVVNTQIWTAELNYHIDLTVTNPQKAEAYLSNAKVATELWPNYELPPAAEMPA